MTRVDLTNQLITGLAKLCAKPFCQNYDDKQGNIEELNS